MILNVSDAAEETGGFHHHRRYHRRACHSRFYRVRVFPRRSPLARWTEGGLPRVPCTAEHRFSHLLHSPVAARSSRNDLLDRIDDDPDRPCPHAPPTPPTLFSLSQSS